ncbi:DNA/RNA non-specific endonuclease [Nocardioides sp. zg-1228]|uniref:DNA/RNA non-specific endonuclease n=1 Tax=Nocardioides sp. zg-1228 TaxID=2763008 RepID=UPI001642982B|nr:DNA/RNA non-specific endonuclease [Nocardioides sp. zg-1228]MBC2934268.1 DNA/RNA non-specific endonuclease [Nocardioides sp. zg-1228]QSF59048.1 DNA/RNA non-specific endonuclease [Nocardioides sp. zg-1228]
MALGYDARFLRPDPDADPGAGAELAPPTAPAPGEDDDPVAASPLDYTHFTVRMHPERRLAWWVAWNIDGLRLFPGESISRSGERFRLDPRLPADAQVGEAAYADNDLDRGHVARRSDLLWGTLAEARQANSDSFFFTNITPQHQDFNQSGRGGVWGLLENAVLALDGLQDRRLSLFAGPVLAPTDPLYRGVRLPVEYWKVVVYVADDQLRAKAFVLTQDLSGLERAVPDFLDEFDTYLVPLDLLEQRTGLAFASLREHAAPDDLRREGAALVTDVDQVAW